MMIYLDNSATTRPFDEVREIMNKVMDTDFGNPSSMHNLGVVSENYIKKSKEQIAKTLKCKESEILFTSGGTESDNMAIIGGCMANARIGKHIITTGIEHPAILETCAFMEKQGYEVTYLPVGKDGRVKIDDLKSALRKDTVIVSIMHVNNEIGSVMPLEEIGKIVKENNPATLFHVDSVQGYGKYKITPKKLGIDLLSISGHKIHGPKGVGILYIAEKTKISPIIFGGGQQKAMRSGTENVPGIAGIGLAAELIYKDFDEKINKLYELKQYFVTELLKIENVCVNGLIDDSVDIESIKMTAPHVVSASIKGIRAEVMLHTLEDRDIFVSSGSACASNKPAISATLKSIGLQQELLDSTIRFSMSVETTRDDIEKTLEVLNEVIPQLRKYSRH
ncbi:MAG: cysteine desulfurase family protein [Lachnospiraceae bacterium]|nr:cysteine desulfurase family protein [Lachnospiraceae bacterium]